MRQNLEAMTVSGIALLLAWCLGGFAPGVASAQPQVAQGKPLVGGPGQPSGPAPGTGPGTGPGPGPAPSTAPAPEAGPGPSEAEQYFLYAVCNKSSHVAFVAIASRLKPGSATWRNHGWYSVQRGQCRDLGSYPMGTFYWFARDAKGGTWGNGDLPDERTCVNLNGAFDFSYSDAANSCRPGYRSVRFRKIVVKNVAWQTTLND